MFSIAYRSFRSRIQKKSGRYHASLIKSGEPAMCREELEAIFAYEFRVAYADILKMKVYGKDERFKSGRIVQLGMEHEHAAEDAQARKAGAK